MRRIVYLQIAAFVLLGCSSATSSRNGGERDSLDGYAGEWTSLEKQDRRLFIAGNRWLFSERDPERFVFDGVMSVDEDIGAGGSIGLTLLEPHAQYESQQAAVDRYRDRKLTLLLDGDKMSISSAIPDCIFAGEYEYSGDSSPFKGYNSVQDWANTK